MNNGCPLLTTLKRLPLSLPIICIAIGASVFLLPTISLQPLPLSYPTITERFTEFVVIIALMGAGLKLDRVFGWGRWSTTWQRAWLYSQAFLPQRPDVGLLY
jgi:hypothetical protein